MTPACKRKCMLRNSNVLIATLLAAVAGDGRPMFQERLYALVK